MKDYRFVLPCSVPVVKAFSVTVQAENVKTELQMWIKEQAQKVADVKSIKDALKPDFALFYGVQRFSTLTEYKTVSKYIERAVKAVQDAANKEAGKPEAGKPEAGKDAGKDAGKPEAGKPEAGKPEAGKPEAGKPEAGKPEAEDTELEEFVDKLTIEQIYEVVECLYMMKKQDFLTALKAVTGKTLK